MTRVRIAVFVGSLAFLVVLAAVWLSSKSSFLIVVIGNCSINRSHLSMYGYQKETTPNLARLSENSFVFRNFTSHLSWGASLQVALRAEYEHRAGGKKSTNPLQVNGTEFSRNRLEEMLETVKQQVLSGPSQVVSVGIRIAHFPYMGKNRNEIHYERFLSERSRGLAEKYSEILKRPDVMMEKVPLLGLLFDDNTVLHRAAHMAGIPPATDPIGLLNSELFLGKWQRSKDFVADVELLREAYDAKLHFADAAQEKLFSFFDSDSQKQKTIVVYAGNHGTALMEHGHLHNGNVPYDDVIMLPLIIRVPGVSGRHYIDQQVSPESIARLLFDISDGKVDPRDLQSVIQRYQDKIVFSRDCAKTTVSVRFENRWKLIKNDASDQTALYDLAADAGETRNVAPEHPDVVGMLEEILIERHAEIERINSRPCPSWSRLDER